MYEAFFRDLQVVFLFSPFKFLKELKVTPSQLHISSWVMVKAFQFWCEYKNSVPYNYFCICSTFLWFVSSGEKGRELIKFLQGRKFFELYGEPVGFPLDRYFLVFPMSIPAHKNLCNLPELGDNALEALVA
jgi:hypothetical protein